jgi:hypothetical protein
VETKSYRDMARADECLLLALSWPNLPCALKAAIGIGKQTLSNPRQA